MSWPDAWVEETAGMRVVAAVAAVGPVPAASESRRRMGDHLLLLRATRRSRQLCCTAAMQVSQCAAARGWFARMKRFCALTRPDAILSCDQGSLSILLHIHCRHGRAARRFRHFAVLLQRYRLYSAEIRNYDTRRQRGLAGAKMPVQTIPRILRLWVGALLRRADAH